jgi:hypothetical protein
MIFYFLVGFNLYFFKSTTEAVEPVLLLVAFITRQVQYKKFTSSVFLVSPFLRQPQAASSSLVDCPSGSRVLLLGGGVL